MIVIPDDFDWYPSQERVQFWIRMAMRDNKSIGPAINFADGEKWSNDLANKVVFSLRSDLDKYVKVVGVED